MKTGIDLIAEERGRQLFQEKMTHSHDDHHREGELANAAVCYIASGQAQVFDGVPTPALLSLWPFDASWWKPTKGDPIRDLVKAGALVAAEIDRIQRMNGESQ